MHLHFQFNYGFCSLYEQELPENNEAGGNNLSSNKTLN